MAICPAFLPFPYSFVSSDEAAAWGFVRRVVRRLHAFLRRGGVRLSGDCSSRCGRSFVFLQLPACVRRVAVIIRSPGNSRRGRRVFVPLAVALPITGVSRRRRQGSDAKNEHECARKPQFHFSPSYWFLSPISP